MRACFLPPDSDFRSDLRRVSTKCPELKTYCLGHKLSMQEYQRMEATYAANREICLSKRAWEMLEHECVVNFALSFRT